MRRGGKSRLICLLAVQSPANNKKPWRFQIAFSLGLVSERTNQSQIDDEKGGGGEGVHVRVVHKPSQETQGRGELKMTISTQAASLAVR